MGTSGFGLAHARERQRRSVQGHAGVRASRRCARGETLRAVAGHARPSDGAELSKSEPSGGTITASKVVIASGYPTDDFKPLRRRFTRCDSYVVLTSELPAGVRREMTPPGLILRDTASPDHWLHWVGNRVLFSGADQASVPDRAKERAIVQRTGQLMYELSVMRSAISGAMPEYPWDVEYSRTIDGVPVLRTAPELSAPLLRVWRRAWGARPVLHSGADPPSSLSGTARKRRRTILIHAHPRMSEIDLAGVRPASR